MPQTVTADAVAEALPGGEAADYGGSGTPNPPRWVLCLDYRECRVGDAPPIQSPAQGPQYSRIRDGYRLRIAQWKDVCPEDYTNPVCEYEAIGRGWPLHISLMAKSLTCPSCDGCSCVVLATGRLEARQGQRPAVRLDDDHWRYRPLVYTNTTLGAVIRCFHDGLPRIAWMNWAPYTHFAADEFLNRLASEHLQVAFDQDMKEHTVTNLRSCRLSIFLTEEGSCPSHLLIPIRHIEYAGRMATYYFDEDCIERELRNACRRLRKPADVELILHGNMIHNRQGRALDAELIEGFPTGNGVEGGQFVAYFSVGP
jgi:hypothetical protein